MIYQSVADPTLFVEAFQYTTSPKVSAETEDFLRRYVRQFTTQSHKGQLFYIFNIAAHPQQIACRNGDWMARDENGHFHAFANSFFEENFKRAIPAGTVIQ